VSKEGFKERQAPQENGHGLTVKPVIGSIRPKRKGKKIHTTGVIEILA
jgi:hypothetical protein